MSALQAYGFAAENQFPPPTGEFPGMSGRFSAPRAIFRGSLDMKTWGSLPVLTRRLTIALGVSIAAHIAIIFLPYIGGGGQSAGGSGAQGPRTERSLQIQIVSTLATETEPAKPTADLSTQAAAAGTTSSSDDKPRSLADAQSQGKGLLPIAAAPYYNSDQLSKRPELLSDDPLDAQQLRVLASSGKLMLKLWINDRGQVVDAVIEKSELPAEFSAAAAAAFKEVRFSPGERDGLPVGSVIRIEVRYSDTRRSSS